MVYHVIGLMSGSSLDGLDIAYVQLEEVRGQWSYQIHHAACKPYTSAWANDLRAASGKPVADFLQLHTTYGHYIGQQVNAFIEAHGLLHKVHFIASHGHTVYHNPAAQTTFQIGEGAAIAVETGLPVISDLRAVDVALGGQGAPIVPVGDKLLFADYDYLLNIGGIANLTVRNGDETLAFDVCPANQALNLLAQEAGNAYDKDGIMAASGKVLPDVLASLNRHSYYAVPAPKSLSNEAAVDMIMQTCGGTAYALPDRMHTVVRHIAAQVKAAVKKYPVTKDGVQMLVTGGGALNLFLTGCLQEALSEEGITVVIPDAETIQYKEAVVMALFGALRWREEVNVYSSVTGALRDSVGGALWIGQ